MAKTMYEKFLEAAKKEMDFWKQEKEFDRASLHTEIDLYARGSENKIGYLCIFIESDGSCCFVLYKNFKKYRLDFDYDGDIIFCNKYSLAHDIKGTPDDVNKFFKKRGISFKKIERELWWDVELFKDGECILSE